MTHIGAWVGAGVFTAGVSAAMLAGAGTASADDHGPSKHDKPSTSAHRDSGHRNAHAVKQRAKSKVSGVKARAESKDPDAKTRGESKFSGVKAKVTPTLSGVKARAESKDPDAKVAVDSDVERRAELGSRHPATVRDRAEGPRQRLRKAADLDRVGPRTQIRATDDAVSDVADDEVAAETPTRVVPVRERPAIRIPHERGLLASWRAKGAVRDKDVESLAAAKEVDKSELQDNVTQEAAAPQKPAQRSPLDTIGDVIRSLGAMVLNPAEDNYPKPLTVITDAVFNTLATVERVVGGDPGVPPELRDKVQVSTSTLVVAPGHEVEANWYFPTTDSGAAPTRMIYLQHGFLANGPQYSYTASYLAQQTNSIVVTTTYSSNPFAADGMWLGGNNLHKAVADLFLDPERTALNASMDNAELKAGREENFTLPTEFVVVGHSLGGGFAPGVAGYYAEGLANRREAGEDAPNELAGVITYDAVPAGSIVPDAMGRLADLQASNGNSPDDYIPVYEIGAPLNIFNSASNVNNQLIEARPDQFTGVVLRGGVHMDSMRGSNPLIQAAAFLIAGFPEPQNPLAVRELSVGWINDMFDENIDPATGACKSGVQCAGEYGDGTDTFTIHTDKGDAVAVMIGSPEASHLSSLENISVTDFISAIPAGVLNGLVTTCDLFTGGKCSA